MEMEQTMALGISRSPKFMVGLAAFIGMTVSSPAILSINPLLLKPMVAEFDWGRATLSSTYLVAAPVMALLYTIVGPALDRFGVRRMLLVGYLLFGAATALMSQLNGSIVQLLALKVIVTSFATIPTGVAFGKVISSHFTDRRGTMLGLCLGGGGGFGMMVLPLIGAQVLEQAGWRGTYVVAGAIAAVVGLLAVSLLPRDRLTSADRAAAVPQHGMTGREARKTSVFMLLFSGTFLSCMVLNGTVQHLSAIMTDVGMSTQQSAFALSIYAAAMICGQFGIGMVLDRVSSPRIAIPVLCVALVGIFLLYGTPGKLAAFAGAACIGASAGSEYGLLPYMVSRYFGLRSFGQLYGLIYAAAALGTGIGPYAMGAAFDLTGEYDRALVFFGAALIAVIVLFSRLRPYTFSAKGEALTHETEETAPLPADLPAQAHR